MSLSQEYIDNYPFNIESPQGVTIVWSPDIDWNMETQGFPTGEESAFQWSTTFIPYTYNEAKELEINHVWMRMKYGLKGTWSMPMRLNYPDIVVGPTGATGIQGKQGITGKAGIAGKYVSIEYANSLKTIVPYTSAYIKYVRFRMEGMLPSAWFQIVGTDGVGVGGTGLPSGGTTGQMLARTPTGYEWIDKTDVYSDADVLDVIGAKANSNPMNHDRYTNSEAVAAMGVLGNSNPLNHNRYTDVEAAAAALAALSASPPIDITLGVVTHLNTNGYKHIPTGGAPGQGLATDGAGNYSWVGFLTLDVIDDTAGDGDTNVVYSADKIVELLSLVSTYGIKYSWADAAARAAQMGMVLGDLGLQQDTRDVYQFDGAVWQLHFNLDSAHTHDTRYYTETELNTSGGGGQVHWDNITNVPTDIGNWDVVGTQLIPSDPTIMSTLISIGGTNTPEYWAFQTNAAAATRQAGFRTFFDTGGGTKELIAGLVDDGSNYYGALLTDYSDLFVGSTVAATMFVVGGNLSNPTLSPFSIDSTGVRLDSTAANKIVETDAQGYLITATKEASYNKAFGTIAGTVSEGDHTHLALLNYRGTMLNSANLNTYLASGDEKYYSYGIVKAAGAPLFPTSFPSDSIVTSYTTGGSTGAGDEFLLIVSPIGNSGTIQEIWGVAGRLAYRRYVGGIWDVWYSHWASDADMIDVPASRQKLEHVSPYKLSKHGTRVNITPTAVFTVDASFPLSTRVLTDGKVELSGRIYYSGHVAGSYIGTINTSHANKIKYNADGYVYARAMTSAGSLVVFRISNSTKRIELVLGTASADYQFNEVYAVD